MNTTVTEKRNCEYSISIENALACPYQCITEDPSDPTTFTICGGNGKCAADPYAEFVRCICYDGYTGDDCQNVATTTSSTIIPVIINVKKTGQWLTAIVILIFIIILLILFGYVWHKRSVNTIKQQYNTRQKVPDNELFILYLYLSHKICYFIILNVEN